MIAFVDLIVSNVLFVLSRSNFRQFQMLFHLRIVATHFILAAYDSTSDFTYSLSMMLIVPKNKLCNQRLSKLLYFVDCCEYFVLFVFKLKLRLVNASLTLL